MMPRYWLACTTPEKFRVDQENEFALDGFRERELRRLLRVGPGDRLVHYVKGANAFAAITEARHTCFLDWTPIWQDEAYPCRLETRPVLVLPLDKALPAQVVLPRLSFATGSRASPAQSLSRRSDLREISQQDYQLLEAEMRRIAEEGRNA